MGGVRVCVFLRGAAPTPTKTYDACTKDEAEEDEEVEGGLVISGGGFLGCWGMSKRADDRFSTPGSAQHIV